MEIFLMRKFLTISLLLASSLLLFKPTVFATNNIIPAPTQAEINAQFERYKNDHITFTAMIVAKNSDETTRTNLYQATGKISTIVDAFKSSSLESEFASQPGGFTGYNKDNTVFAGIINFRGAQLTVHSGKFVDPNGNIQVTTLTFCLMAVNPDCTTFFQNNGPATGSSAKYHASTSQDDPTQYSKEDIWDQLSDYLKGSLPGSKDFLKQLADLWVSNTSIDPVAGNPQSLLANMTTDNFNIAANLVTSPGEKGLGLFSVSPSYYTADNDGFPVSEASLPFKWSNYLNNDNAIFFYMPINYQMVKDATSYDLTLGLGFSHVMARTHNVTWALVPSISTGLVGSPDLGSGTLAYNGGLASNLSYKHDTMTYKLINDVSYVKTAALKIGDVETPYDIDNTITENSAEVDYQIHKEWAVGGFYKQSNVLDGHKWYVDSWTDIGLKLMSLTGKNYSNMGTTISYTAAESYSSVNVGFDFNF
jgi:hypothetical protein